MTNVNERHPEMEEILRLAIGDPADSADHRVEQHVRSCWKCRRHLEEARSTLHELARYHEKVLIPNLPDPPRPWASLHAQIASLHGNEIIQRPSGIRIRRLLLATACSACVALAVVAIVRKDKAQHTPAPKQAPTTRVLPQPERPFESSSTAKPREVASAVLPRERTAAPTPSLSISARELRVFAALHEIGADLGDPVEVSAAGTAVRVTGTGLDSARESEIRAAVSRIPDVTIEFSKASELPANAPAARLILNTRHSPFEDQLRRALGGAAQLEQFTNLLLDESDAVLARAHALHTLDDHFPGPVRGGLEPADRAVLGKITADHRAALSQHASRMNRMLERIRGALNPPFTTAAGNNLLPASQRMDRVLAVVFGVTPSSAPPNEILVEFSRAWADLAALAGPKLAAEEGEGR